LVNRHEERVLEKDFALNTLVKEIVSIDAMEKALF